jgi:hypothetical protein
MEVVTYLLGAGASAQCLPVVNKMAEDIMDTYKFFHSIFYANNSFPEGSDKVIRNNNLAKIKKDLEWLGKVCENHYSVDTYAKKLYLKGEEEEYSKLKNVLSLYFTIKQKLYLPDKRYDNFWASILDEKDRFPKNMRIISWNYDSQLELSYRNFVSSNISLEEAYGRVKMSSFHDERLIPSDDFAIFKLNGSIKKVKKSQGRNFSKYLVDNFNLEENKGFFERLMDSYLSLQPDEMKTGDEMVNNEISFAWEHNYTFGYYQNMNKSVIDTTVLVVIGYSFPFFNRKLDKRIINDYMPMLQKVYFQAPDPENLKERFLSLNSRVLQANMFLREDKNQFTFPNELDI